MWLEKLTSGVLRVLTPLGPRYLNPSFAQRLYLIWIFRHFQTLPVKVLNSRQRHMIESMCANNQFVPLSVGFDEAPVLGTLEQRPPVPPPSLPRRPTSSVRDSVSPLAADVQR
ncbi:MAG TPA: hypothetical protein VFA85_16840 [Terriglobales bacterium]|nr:hypothetical protein [Terriglobales bacterium]